MKRWLPLLVLLPLLVFGFVLLRPKAEPGAGGASSNVTVTAPAPAAGTGPTTAPPGKAAVPVPTEEGVSPKFLAMLRSEAKSLNATNVNVAEAEAHMKELVGSMGEKELKFAADSVLSFQGPANERILDAYAVSRAICQLPPGSPARKAAFEAAERIVTQEFHSGHAGAHTAEELENAQAKSFGVMNVDGLAECAAHDAEAREVLVRLGSLAKDSTIQKAILDKVRGLPPL